MRGPLLADVKKTPGGCAKGRDTGARPEALRAALPQGATSNKEKNEDNKRSDGSTSALFVSSAFSFSPSLPLCAHHFRQNVEKLRRQLGGNAFENRHGAERKGRGAEGQRGRG